MNEHADCHNIVLEAVALGQSVKITVHTHSLNKQWKWTVIK